MDDIAIAMIRFAIVIFGVLLGTSSAIGACVTCHADVAESLTHGAHAAIDANKSSPGACVACHGQGQAHSQNPESRDVFAFLNESTPAKNAVCADCHREQHNAGRGIHAVAGLACVSCHKAHDKDGEKPLASGGLAIGQLDPGTGSCIGCHADVFSEFQFNKRHRLNENSITCVSCHDPHAEKSRQGLGNSGDVNCSGCHADKDGPFVFEHSVSRVEGCTACHSPHGSANRHLLKHQDVGEQCYSCHAGVAQFHLGFSPAAPPRFDTKTVCTNCHSTIHGSNLDRLFLK